MTGAGMGVLKRLANGAILVGERCFPLTWSYYLDTGSALSGMTVAGSTVAHLLEASAITRLAAVTAMDDEVKYRINAVGEALLVAQARHKREKATKRDPQAVLFDLTLYDNSTPRKMD